MLISLHLPRRSICSGCKKATKGGETKGRAGRGSGRAKIEGGIRSLAKWHAFRWFDKRRKKESAVLLLRLQGRVGSTMRSLFYLLVLRLPLAYNYIRWFTRRSNGQKHGCDGVAGFRFCLRYRLRIFLWATSHHSRLHRPSFSLRDDSLRILQVSMLPRYVSQNDPDERCRYRCRKSDWNYMSFRFWIGSWITLILLILVAIDASAFVCYITRFTEENFATLIAFIFIYKVRDSMLFLAMSYPGRTQLFASIQKHWNRFTFAN